LFNLLGTKYVVRIRDHSFLEQTRFDGYILCMDHCDFSLQDYIRYHRNGRELPIPPESQASSSSVLASKDKDALTKAENTYEIGIHIASGLQFLHAHKVLHTALESKHGMGLTKQAVNLLVLFSQLDAVWKIAGFRIADGDLTITPNSAPEIYKTAQQYTPEMDMWDIGCILYELAFLKLPFSTVEDASKYSQSGGVLPPEVHNFFLINYARVC
jgi:hypothetical protein